VRYCVLSEATFVIVKKMEKDEFRVLIKHYFLMGKNTVETKTWLDECYPDSAPSKATICRWFADFKRGRVSTNDAERSGRPKEVVTPENIKKIHKIILNDRKVKLIEIAETLKISKERVGHIVHEYLDMRKLFAKWVPRELTIDQKQQRFDDSEECLAMIKRNKSDFLRRYVTMDETWLHHYTPESNRQSAEWTARDESNPNRPKTQQSAGKVMASVFWDAHGIIFIDYLEKGKTINSDYYIALLGRLKDEIAEKRPHLKKKKVLFHQDNAPCHKSMKTMAKLNELGYELLPHPPYSPDLAPSDYFLFADLKRALAGKKFKDNDGVIAETEAYFADKTKEYYKSGIEKLEDRYNRCIALEGNYVE
jgi:[histone H3]-lysine36 N-dimethyltransferase SETMAR